MDTTGAERPPPAGRPRRPGPALPWSGPAQRADLVIVTLIGLSGVYALALLPVVPALLGPHPLLLELISGSTLAEVTVGAHGRPHLEVRGTVAGRAAQLGVTSWHVSLSHDGGIASALVIAEGLSAGAAS